MTIAVSNHGTLLKMGDGASPEVFATVLEVRAFNAFGVSLNAVEVTNQSSTAHYKEFIGGLLDAGEVSGEFNWHPSNATQSATAGMKYVQDQRTLKNWQIVTTHTSPLTATFAAIVTQFGPVPIDMEGAFVCPFTLKISGAYTWA